MLRRQAISLLLTASARAGRSAPESLASFFETGQGSALLLEIRTRRLIAAHGTAAAAALLAPPGSTLKPFILAALLRTRRLNAEEPFPCPERLSVAGRAFDCTHPRQATAMQVRTALAYSCNCFVAHFADRFMSGEIARNLERAGLDSLTGIVGTGEAAGRIQPASGADANRLQALGEERVVVTLAELAMAYRALAMSADREETRPVLDGLEGAVEFGTAQLAKVEGLKVAGKTGSVRTSEGARVAWFAGFAPSRVPEVVVAVMLQGRSGGSDAAPVAGRILAAHHAGRI